MEATKKQLIQAELERIADDHGGVLNPKDVVEFAQNPKTVLHSEFEWNNTKAGEEYRLWQARQLIRVVVHFEPRVEQEVRTYVSLPSDRRSDDPGYRRTVEVISDADRRKQLLNYALAELAVFERKYSVLKELAGVFSAFKKARSKAKDTKRKTVAAR